MLNGKEEIDKIYSELSPRADILYRFVMTYADYINGVRDYGTNISINMVEVHTLSMIEDNPGITVSQLAKRWERTKGAISQNVSKLEKKGLVQKIKDEKNNKIVHLFVTKDGEHLSTAHKIYDITDIMQTQQELLENCTIEEINTFYKVLQEYYKLF